MTTALTYSLKDFHDVIANGFNFELSDDIVKIISGLAQQVGSPDYVKTPVFLKKSNPMKVEPDPFKKKRANRVETDVNWERATTFQPTKLESKEGVAAKIDAIRSFLNKMTDKNYIDIRNKVIDVIDTIDDEDMSLVSITIFDIASTNRFFSKIYADLYSDLISKYGVMRTVFEESLNKFIDLFNNIEYVDSIADYDRFCKINKDNEKRKALSAFFVNLMINKIISKEEIVGITRNLLNQICEYIVVENKKNEVDELTENVGILYDKHLYDGVAYDLIDGMTINETVIKLSKCKLKDYKSLTNKTIFKFMDLVEK
jgi:hypothetical protein